MAGLMDLLQRDVEGVSQELAPDDRVYRVDPDFYFAAGQLAVRCVRLAMLAAGKREVTRILDLPCGHGRVLRTLKAAFPDASLTACDIRPEGVDFCAQTFGATPVYAKERAAEIDIAGPFDLIFCGSLLTHLDLDSTREFLDLFESLLDRNRGLLVFTTHGHLVAERVRRGIRPFGMDERQREEFLADFDRDGFAYYDHMGPGDRRTREMPSNYGISLASPAWICRELESRKSVRLVHYIESGWGNNQTWWSQDVVACVRSDLFATGGVPAPADTDGAGKT
jgi:SAM-dependent methyltransferase